MKQLFLVSFGCEHKTELLLPCKQGTEAYLQQVTLFLDQTVCLDKKSRVILKLASVSINLIWGSVLCQVLGFLVS